MNIFERQLRIAAARMNLALGFAGWSGLVLFALAATLYLYTMHLQNEQRVLMSHAMEPLPGQLIGAIPGTQPTGAMPLLPYGKDTPQIIQTVQKALQANSVNWPNAEYRYIAVSPENIAALEIRTAVKGSYPQIRRALTTLLDQEPAMAIREMAFSRSSSDSAEVEAKLKLAVFLSDGWLPETSRQLDTQP